jgi:hypothetical protein
MLKMMQKKISLRVLFFIYNIPRATFAVVVVCLVVVVVVTGAIVA